MIIYKMNYSPANLDSFEHMKKKDGSENPKYVDVLETDKKISGQNYCCISFISPENIIKKKELFYFEEFLKTWELNKSMEKFHQFMNFISYKYKLQAEDVMKDLEDFVKEEKENIVNSQSIEDDYKNFMDKQEETLEAKFNINNKFQTSVRGIKNRGNYPTLEEAELKAKMLRKNDPNFDVFVGPVGTWVPWEPVAYKTGRVEHLEEELNQLVHEKTKNEDYAKEAFEKRVKESKEAAIAENKANAEKYGSSITQDVDDQGNLIEIKPNSSSEATSDTAISVSDIRKELFEGDDIVTSKNTDHGISSLTNGIESLLGKKEIKQD